MKVKVALVLVLCLAAVATLGIGASAAAADTGWPGVGTPHVAHVWPTDGHWWSGGAGWGNDYAAYAPGTPIPAQYSVSMFGEAVMPVRSDVEGIAQDLLLSLTVKDPDGDVIVKVTEAQSAQYWTDIKWWPAAGWWRGWEVQVGQLPAGTYRVTFVMHQPDTVVVWDYDDNGNLAPTVVKAFKDTYHCSFTMW
jgi:hypothetical protein